jgi:hypothetical protein
MSKKKSASTVPEASATPALTVRIIKIGTCLSLSGKSTITFQLGHVIAEEGADHNIHVRVYANSGRGFFSDEWVAMSSIHEVFDKLPAGQPITSYMLYPLFRGKSLNSPGFMLAVLQDAGFVRHMQDRKRNYELGDPSVFMAEMVELIDAGTDLRGDVKRGDVKSAQGKTVSEKSASKKSKAAAVPVDAVPAMPDDASQEQAEK